MNLQELVSNIINNQDEPPRLAKEFFDNASKSLRYAIGRNNETLQINDLIRLRGVIDDFEVEASSWYGIPIVKTDDVPKDALVANCATSISPVAALNHLEASGLKNVIGLHELGFYPVNADTSKKTDHGQKGVSCPSEESSATSSSGRPLS
jgi:hypothetical protein